ncbi:SCO family protein [Nannocystis sp. SCPEA4]|uniref:SCO family protein n=1 Tax=Nannocystis sp. SCPEA4 TaxID=2996787 RepID=UPI00226F0BD7|nr:SCO family protein [Nannocystis sp. SCPEA4]MCY1055205.1 SCO family protein [Nannocystis sp. SCPEA4]
MSCRIPAACLSAALAFGSAAGVRAAPLDAQPAGSNQVLAPAMTAIDVDEHLGLDVDRGLSFVDHNGKSVTLGDYLDGKRPVLVTMNYFRCPVLCNVQLNELTDTLAKLDWTAGDEHFRIVTVSIDPRETTELAKSKRHSHLHSLDRGDDVDWAFLTGDALNVRLLAAQLGISYTYDPEQDQYAHPAVIAFLSPEGKIARYVYGLSYMPNDLKFALIEASEGRVGSTIDRLILSCFHYDATLGRYGPFAFGLMRIAGAVTVLLIGTALLVYWRRERRATA